MTLRHMILFFAVSCLSIGFAFAGPEDAPSGKDLYAQGQELLKQGDFTGAFKTFSAAAKADPENKDYASQAMMVRRVMSLRKFVDTNEVSPKWEKMLISLHAFYLTNGVNAEAVAMDRMAHKKMNNALSAALLSEALLDSNMNAEALAHIQGLDDAKMDEQNRVYLGIALARNGHMAEAKVAREEVPVNSETSVGLLYDVARLDSLVGDRVAACRTLTTCFEQLPPTQLVKVKVFVEKCPDFTALHGSTAFAAAMKTQSKITESSCSGGTSCGTCPSKASCGSAATEATEESGCGSCDKKSECDSDGDSDCEKK